MNRKPWLVLLSLCLLLTACNTAGTPPNQASVIKEPVCKETSQTDRDGPVSLGRLTVELVVDWEETDRILSSLDQLSELLGEGLLAQGYAAEGITVTISTAGGITGSALAEGGVDAACMPATDYAECGDGAAAILVTDEAVSTGVVAVTTAREELDEAFRAALASALRDTSAGVQFLETCYPGTAYVPATEEALQAIRSLAAEQGESAHGQ